jgi:hypothetical protein
VKIESDAVIPFERPLVFRTYRDEIQSFADRLPLLRGIDLESRSEEGTRVVLENTWHPGAEIPAAIRKLLTRSVFCWHEHSEWDEATFHATWRIETDPFGDAVRCSGEHRFVDIGGRTRLEMEGNIEIDLGRLKAMPAFLAEGIERTLEQFLVRQITSNLASVADGLTAHLAAARGEPA